MARRIVVLLILIFVIVGVALVWNGRLATPPGEASSEFKAVKYPGTDRFGEAPGLHKLVVAGSLSPVDRRLPANPAVVHAIESPGKYFDTLRSIQTRNDKYYSSRIVYESGLAVWSADGRTYSENLADHWEVSKDARSYTFHLREGLRWSDGNPFTASDIQYVIQDVIQDARLGVGFPTPWMSFENVKFSKADDQTFTLMFEMPQGNLLERLAGIEGKSLVMYSKEFCSQFDPKYNKKASEVARQAGFSSVEEYFFAHCPHFHGNLDSDVARPTMNAWVPASARHGSDQAWRYRRNPYYFKVDELGNQLPYADSFVFDLVDSTEDRMLKAMSGAADLAYSFTMAERPLLYKNMLSGGYRLIDVIRDGGPNLVIGFNRTGPDAELSALAADKKFRIAASLAINRVEICKAVYSGMCEPFQAAPLKGTPFYDEEFAKEYTEFAPERANGLLDEIGLRKRDSDGIRLLHSGNPLAFTLAYYARDPENADVLEFVQRYWRNVGIKLIIRSMDQASFESLMDSGQYSISAMTGPNALYTYNPWAMIPTELRASIYASGWYGYLQNQLAKTTLPFVEPDEGTKKAINAYVRMTHAASPAERDEYMRQIVANAKEQFYLIGTFTDPPQTGLVRRGTMNLPNSFILSWQRAAPSNLQPAQWWKK